MKECYWLRNRLRVECVEESSVQSRAFENGDVSLVLTQVRLNREHLNVAKFEPEQGPDPMLDLVLVGSKW
ncbi:hypothetical protein OIU78_001967 [Salix suchowensis]|nr:hypothetical protein OIU78_001967 [Salix suchowensis]